MLFTVGISVPSYDNEAFGGVVPALFTERYSCFTGAESVEEILPMATEAIQMMLEQMLIDGFDITKIKDEGFQVYQQNKDFDFCDTWLLVDVDITPFLGKQQIINVTLPEYLLNKIHQKLDSTDLYQDRDHFIAQAVLNHLI